MREADVPAPRARRDEEREVPSVARSEPVERASTEEGTEGMREWSW